MRRSSVAARAGLAAALTLSFVLASAPARANGRFPASAQLLVDPSNPDRLWLRSTRGVLTSADHGCTWYWICEESIGVSGEEDPPLAITANGSVLAAVFRGVFMNEDHGCSWRHDFPWGERFAVDVSVEKRDQNRALVVISAGKGDAGAGNWNQIWRSTDSGKNWAQVGADLDPSLRLETLDTAPSDPTRFYATGLDSTGKGVLLRSDNDGAEWQTLTITGTDTSHVPYLSAVHPTDPQKLYVRVQGPKVGQYVENSLLYSADGGHSWTELMKKPADMLGFALSPDGNKVLVGLGDTRSLYNSRPVDKSVLGIYSASTADHVFTRQLQGQVGCLTWTAQGLYVCTSEFAQGYELGLSLDEGKTTQPVLYLAGIKEPLSCPAGTTTANFCTQSRWLPVCQDTNRCDRVTNASLPIELPTQCGGANPDAGTTPAKDNSKGDSSCGCHVPGSPSSSGSAWAAGLVALGLFAARRGGQKASIRPPG